MKIITNFINFTSFQIRRYVSRLRGKVKLIANYLFHARKNV